MRRPVHPDRDLRVLYALSGASGAAFLPFFALLLRDRGFAPDEIGMILAASSLAGVVVAPVWSHVADTSFGSVLTLQVSTLASGAATLMLLFTGSILWATLGVVAVVGFVSGPRVGIMDSLALDHLGPRRASEYGTIRLWASLGWAIAVLAFGAWFEQAGLGPVVPAYVVGLLAFAAVLTRFPVTRPSEHEHRGTRFGSVGAAFRASPRLLPFLVGVLFVGTATSAAWNFVPLRIASHGGGPFLVGLSACLAALVEIPFMQAGSWFGRHVGLRTLYAIGCAVYVAMAIAWALVANPVVVALIKAASGVGFSLTYVALVVITGRLVPANLQNTGQALMQTTGQGIAPIVGSAVGGFVYGHLGPPTLFLGSGVLTAAGAAIAWRALEGGAFSSTRSGEHSAH